MIIIVSFDTNFKSNSSSIGNAVGLLDIELTIQTGLLGIELTIQTGLLGIGLTAQTGLLGIELTSPSMNIKASGLLTASGMFQFISLAQFISVLTVPPGLV